LYTQNPHPQVVSFVVGLGGRDITVDGFETIVKRGMELAKSGSDKEFQIFGLRE
jgi:pyruvate ferredoxin oxidoreductase alpha subunit